MSLSSAFLGSNFELSDFESAIKLSRHWSSANSAHAQAAGFPVDEVMADVLGSYEINFTASGDLVVEGC